MIKTKKKELIYGLKPYRWLKGSALVLLGLLLSRWGIGVGRLDTNIYFGVSIYFLITSSTILVSIMLKIEESSLDRSKSLIKKLIISSATLFSAAYITSICHTILYNLDSLNIFILSFIGIALVLAWYYRKNWEKQNKLISTVISLFFSFGIIYSAALNGLTVPASVFLFFGVVFSLEFSKDLITESKNKERYSNVGVDTLTGTLGEDKTQKLSFILDLMVILLLLLPLIPGLFYIPSLLLYSIPMLITIILIGVAALFTFLMKPEKTYYKLVKILLKIGMFFVFTTIFMASF